MKNLQNFKALAVFSVIVSNAYGQYDQKCVTEIGGQSPCIGLTRTPATTVQLWDNGIVYYTLHQDEQVARNLENAFQEFQQKTCLKFVPRTNQPDYVKIFSNTCSCNVNWVGRKGGEQKLKIGQTCDAWTSLHLLGHIVGLHHEFQHPRRDTYVKLNVTNLQSWVRDTSTYCGNVKKVSLQEWKNFGGCYDVNSIMGWGPKWGTIDATSPNMVPIANDLYIIHNNGSLSFWDIYRLNKLYRCKN